MGQDSSLHRPLSAKKVVNNEDSVDVWINNPSPYFTYIPDIASDGKSNIILVGYPGYQLSEIDFALTGPYETTNDLEKLYGSLKLVKDAYKFGTGTLGLTTITDPPKSLDLIEGSTEEINKLLDFGKIVEISAPSSDLALGLKLADTDPVSIGLTVLKSIYDPDCTARYIFIDWFLLLDDPINDLIRNEYENTQSAKVYYNHKITNALGVGSVSGSIESKNLLDGNKDDANDQFWPRGWYFYKNKYGLPKTGKGFVLLPDNALVFRFTRTQGDGTTTRTTSSPPSSTDIVSNPEFCLIIREYQSLETIEAESPRPSAEDLENELSIYLPYLTNHPKFGNPASARGDEAKIRDTLSCILNGDYEGSKYLSEGKERGYSGTTLDYYNFRAKFMQEGTSVYTNLIMEKSLKHQLEEDDAKEKEVIFPDTNLEAVIRAAINKPNGAIYTTDLEGLKQLDSEDKSIKEITGLEYCNNLQTLYLHNNQITDVSPLKDLTNLQTLWLYGNQITDVSSLSGLTHIERKDW